MPTAIILSGGVTHDFPVLAQRLTELLDPIGIEATVRTDIDAAMADPGDVDLVIVNMLRWRMREERYLAQAPQWALSLSEPARRGFYEWVTGGGALLALHAASICFDDWPQWLELCGARWIWETSGHPLAGPTTIAVHRDQHPITAGLPATFDTDDEVYGFLELTADVEPLLSAERDGVHHPLLWARSVGAGRVVHNTLGHYLPSYDSPVHQQIVRRSALWALRRPDHEVAHT